MKRLLAALDVDPIVIVDVGSSGGLHSRWTRFGRGVRTIAFDADARAGGSPRALAQVRGRAPLYLCTSQEASSLLAPNQDVFSRFPDAEGAIVESVSEVETFTLDEFVERADFIKLDTQGTEPRILRGGPRVLSSCIGVEAEVCLAELYRGQEGFGGLEAVLRPAGFELFDIAPTWWHRRETCGSREKGQLVFADTLWLRRPEELQRERAVQAVGILAAYRQFSLAAMVAHMLGHEALSQGMQRLSQPASHFRGQRPLARFLWNAWLTVAPRGRGWFLAGPDLGS